LKNYNVSAKESPSEKETEEKVAEEPGFADCKVGFIGLGSMGLGMASSESWYLTGVYDIAE
jgi:hypothetical protein